MAIARQKIFTRLSAILKKYDPAQIAAVFLLTDGEVTDAPPPGAWPANGPPLHVLLVGAPDEQNAWLEIAPAPPYALVGETVQLRVRPHWRAADSNSDRAILTITDGKEKSTRTAADDEWLTIDFPIRHTGPNQLVLQLPKFDDAIFPATQTALININGIAGDVHVLWQSTASNPPAWLRRLTADPQIKLQNAPADNDHFTGNDIVIFNQPFAQANTKWQNSLADYIRGGGHVLFLQNSPPQQPVIPALQNVLPITWNDGAAADSAVTLTPAGQIHPITADMTDEISGLTAHSNAAPNPNNDANVLLTDGGHHALLAISNAGQGRIAALTQSDLFDAAIGEALLRRTLLWLLQEPELATRNINAVQQGDDVRIEYSGDDSVLSLKITRPDRSVFEAPLIPESAALKVAHFTPDKIGIYRISDGSSETFFPFGNLTAPEWQHTAATAEHLSLLATATGGQILWLAQTPAPDVRFVTGEQSGGAEWLALRESRAATITGITLTPLLPKIALLLVVFCALAYAWQRESR